MIKTILYGNVKNTNGRTYTRKTLEKISRQISNGAWLGRIGYGEGSTMELQAAAFYVEKPMISIHRGISRLYVNMYIIDSPMGEVLRKSLKDFVIRPAGSGTENAEGIVDIDSYNLLYLAAVDKKEDSYIEYVNEDDDEYTEFNWRMFREYIRKAKMGSFITRQDIIKTLHVDTESTMDNYRNYLTKAGYLERVGRGKYMKVKEVNANLPVNVLFRQAYKK